VKKAIEPSLKPTWIVEIKFCAIVFYIPPYDVITSINSLSSSSAALTDLLVLDVGMSIGDYFSPCYNILL
jgi:hypothetical protein